MNIHVQLSNNWICKYLVPKTLCINHYLTSISPQKKFNSWLRHVSLPHEEFSCLYKACWLDWDHSMYEGHLNNTACTIIKYIKHNSITENIHLGSRGFCCQKCCTSQKCNFCQKMQILSNVTTCIITLMHTLQLAWLQHHRERHLTVLYSYMYYGVFIFYMTGFVCRGLLVNARDTGIMLPCVTLLFSLTAYQLSLIHYY